jgi:TPR repeat protein
MLFSTGDMAGARLFYERAANVGDAQAALRLGESFDPNFLQAHARGVKGDLGTAISWYRRARELGSADAEILLKSLEGNLGNRHNTPLDATRRGEGGELTKPSTSQ